MASSTSLRWASRPGGCRAHAAVLRLRARWRSRGEPNHSMRQRSDSFEPCSIRLRAPPVVRLSISPSLMSGHGTTWSGLGE